MKHHLNYEKEDDNCIMLGDIFKIIDSRKAEKIMAHDHFMAHKFI
jgi:hypothetical protein